MSTDARDELVSHLVEYLYGTHDRTAPATERILRERTQHFVQAICDPANRDLVLAAMGGTQEPPYAERGEWSEWMDAYGGQRMWHFIEGSET
jgi:hypothetical protein